MSGKRRNENILPLKNTTVEFKIKSDKVINLYRRISGKGSRIRKQALELISKDISKRFSLNKIIEIFTDFDVPKSMFIPNPKWHDIFYVLSYYTTSKLENNQLKALKIIQEILHPLMFEGNEKQINEVYKKYNKWLKYDHICIEDDGKIYIIPTKEEWDLGMVEWIDLNGKATFPKGITYLDQVAELWVLWNQIMILIQAYQDNSYLNQNLLEKLYLEVIEEVENIAKQETVGNLYKIYKRPFTSLATAETEAKAKKYKTPQDLINAFLLKIAEQNPTPKEIKQKMEDSGLIKRIRSAVKNAGSEKIKSKDKLQFYSDTGDIFYNDENGETKNGTKSFALLKFLDKNKNTTFHITDIQENCNSLVSKPIHYFKKEKDIDDTIRSIKFKLKVNKNAYFPIKKKGATGNKEWIWSEK